MGPVARQGLGLKRRVKIDALKTFWDDDDFADPGLDVPDLKGSHKQKQRIFRAWMKTGK